MRAGENARDARRELSVRAVIDRDEQALEIRDKASCLQLLALKSLLLIFTHGNATEGPAQGRRHGHRGYDRHRDNHREKILTEGSHR